MKYTVAFIVAVGLIFTACKKKSNVTHCYVCAQYDSFKRVSNGGFYIFPNGVSDTLCNQNQGMIDFYVSTHVPIDTFYPGTDTVGYGYTYFRCTFLR